MHLRILFKKGKSEEIRYWECKYEGDTFYTRYGVLKTRSKHKWQEHKRSARFDESHGGHRTSIEVATEHAISKWGEKKRNDAMVENPLELGMSYNELLSITQDEDILQQVPDEWKQNPDDICPPKYHVPIAPALAQRYDQLKERSDNPGSKYKLPSVAYYEAKLDGERCTSSWVDGEVKLFSRIRNEIPHCDQIKQVMTKIYNAFSKSIPDIYSYHFDGEVVIPGETRNGMRSAISRIKEKHPRNKDIVYYIFDMVMEYDIPFEERRLLLRKILGKVKAPCVRIVPDYGLMKVNDENVQEYLARSRSEGYEGLVLKTPDMLYPLTNLRINEMIKVKELQDEEVLIVGAHEGNDKEKGMIIFDVQDKNVEYIRYAVRPCWSYTDRQEAWNLYLEQPKLFIGQYGTVAFKSKNEYGYPEECRFMCLRDKDDMDPRDNTSS